jgi:hypothetical protein
MAESTTRGSSLTDLITLYKQLSAFSAALFGPLAKTYVGNLVAEAERRQDKPLRDADVVNLALRKMAFEAGEILMTRNPPTDKPIGAFEFNKDGQLPDYSLAQVAGAALAYMKYRDEQAAKKQAAAKPAPAVEVLGSATTVRALRSAARVQTYQMPPAPAPTVRMTGGCGCRGSTTPTLTTGGCGCGGGCGGTTTTPPSPPPCYDPCAGGLVAVPPAGETCGCSCACQTQPPASCDDLCSMSCETKLRLRDCLKQLICDLLEWIETHVIKAPQPGEMSQIVYDFLDCVRNAICPPPAPPCLPPGSPLPCLPCDYAVENS